MRARITLPVLVRLAPTIFFPAGHPGSLTYRSWRCGTVSYACSGKRPHERHKPYQSSHHSHKYV